MDTAFILPTLKCGVIIPISGQIAQIEVKMSIYARLYHFLCTLSISHATKWFRPLMQQGAAANKFPKRLSRRVRAVAVLNKFFKMERWVTFLITIRGS
jgi:hypothetical protein